MPKTIVDDFYESNKRLLDKLQIDKEISLEVWASQYLNRFFVLIAANYYETELTEAITSFVNSSSNNPLVVSFLKKSMGRQYHTYFDWEGSSANQFFSKFGEEFKKKAAKEVELYPRLNEAIKAFLELGRTRNELSHEKMHEVYLPKTGEEYYDLHKKAIIFVYYVKRKLRVAIPHGA
jgi:hypothetical protein